MKFGPWEPCVFLHMLTLRIICGHTWSVRSGSPVFRMVHAGFFRPHRLCESLGMGSRHWQWATRGVKVPSGQWESLEVTEVCGQWES